MYHSAACNDKKISHKNSEVTKSIIKELEKKFGNFSSVSYGHEHYFLVMQLMFEDRKVGIDVRSHLEKKLQEFMEEGLTPVSTLAKCDLRDLNEGSPKVSENRRAQFHSLVILTMCVSHRGRRCLQSTVIFLS